MWAYDPVVKTLPGDLKEKIRLAGSSEELLRDADAVVVATEWPEYKELKADLFVKNMRNPLVVDANRFLAATLGRDARISYDAVGVPK